MSEYFISPDGKLYHSNGDYLQHWKYIKREKVNGKWRYYYHDDKYEAAKAEYETAKEKSSAKRQKSDAIDKYATERGDVSDPYKSAAKKRASRKAERAEEKTAKVQEKYEEAKEKHENSVGFKIADGLNKLSDGEKNNSRKKEEEPKSNYASASAELEKTVKEYDAALRNYTRQADSIKYLANKYGTDAVNEVEADKANKKRSELKESITKLAEARDKLKEEAEVYKNSEYHKKTDPDYEQKLARMENRVNEITDLIDNSKIKPKASYLHKDANGVDKGKNFIEKLFSKKKKR